VLKAAANRGCCASLVVPFHIFTIVRPASAKPWSLCAISQPPTMLKFLVAFLTSFCICQSCFAQSDSTGTLTLIRHNFKKTANWKDADKDRKFYYGKYPNDYNLDRAIKVIKTEKDFGSLLQAKTYCIDNFRTSIPKLIDLLVDTTKVGLINTADLIIWDRVQSGELKFYGHGGVIEEDLFTVAGRCSYILNELTGEKFLLVHKTTPKQELEYYQRFWTRWFARL
jgi:hypothetical protein